MYLRNVYFILPISFFFVITYNKISTNNTKRTCKFLYYMYVISLSYVIRIRCMQIDVQECFVFNILYRKKSSF